MASQGGEGEDSVDWWLRLYTHSRYLSFPSVMLHNPPGSLQLSGHPPGGGLASRFAKGRVERGEAEGHQPTHKALAMENAPCPPPSPSPGSKSAGKRKMTGAQIRLWYAKQPRVANDDSDDERPTANGMAFAVATEASLHATHQEAHGRQLRFQGTDDLENTDDIDEMFDDLYGDAMVPHPFCTGMSCTESQRATMIELMEARHELDGPEPQSGGLPRNEPPGTYGNDAADHAVGRTDAADLPEPGNAEETALLVHYRNSAVQEAIKREAVAEIRLSSEQAIGDSFEAEVK